MKHVKYVEWIKQIPCIICLIEYNNLADLSNCNSEPHHIEKEQHSTLSRKTSDLRTIPLCRKHHDEVHWIGKVSFQQKYGVNFEDLINRFNRIWREKDEALSDRGGAQGS